MKALIFSDSHGDSSGMKEAFLKHRDAEVCFFLGDGLGDIEGLISALPQVMLLSVAGNCDWFSGDAPKEGLFTMAGKRIFYAHGHTLGVKAGLGHGIAEAKKQQADIFLFGHTHMPLERCDTDGERPLWIFNPGSIGRGYEGVRHYGILEIRENGVLFSHGGIV